MKIRKRDGRIEDVLSSKITNAIIKSTNGKIISNNDIKIEREDGATIWYDQFKLTILGMKCVDEIKDKYGNKSTIEVETIHNEVIEFLKRNELYELAINYSQYREDRNKSRMKNTELMKTVKSLAVERDADNANVGGNFSAKLLRMASEANKCAILGEIPKEYSRAHEIGDVYQHDLDSYNIATNCLHIPAAKTLANGFNTGYGVIKTPQRIESASMLICILIQSVQNK